MRFKYFLMSMMGIFSVALAEAPAVRVDAFPVQSYQSAEEVAPVAASPKSSKTSVSEDQAARSAFQQELQNMAVTTAQQQVEFSKQMAEMREKLADLTQSILLTQQRMNDQILFLDKKTTAMQEEIQQLMQVIKTLKQAEGAPEISAVGAEASRLSVMPWHDLTARWMQSFKEEYLVYGTAVILGLLVALLFMAFAKKKPFQQPSSSPKTASVEKKDDTESEYDFMGSAESIPAKLDLARAYVAMEDYVSAQAVLKHVFAEGNPQQKQEAQDLLNNMTVNA